MYDVTSFNPQEYRYVEIKYKTNDNGYFELVVPQDSVADSNYSIRVSDIQQDGQWHTAVFDLWSNESVKKLEYITGWQLNWQTGLNQIDYIRVIQ